jgi:Asp-tRNA(Asn)/Glu-tRNA(Gln) amidotransferase A subunit family amidase
MTAPGWASIPRAGEECPAPPEWPIRDIAERVRRRQITAREVLENCLERISHRNDTLNAIVTLTEDSARAQAAHVDDLAEQGGDPGPLAGVPFTVKDLIATRGVRSTAGSLLLRDYVPAWGATAVERLCAAGAVLVGKTNCPEFGLAIHTGNRLFGDTLNPLDPDLSPAGSSGGDAAAVAAGMAAFGIGTDYGGSVRVPAHCTGTAAFRPTPGIVPGTGQLPFPPRPAPVPPNTASMQAKLQTIAPIGRHAEDLWPVVQVMAGPDGIDGNAIPVSLADPDAVDITQLQAAWCDGEGTYPIRADVVAAVEAAARALSAHGIRVTACRPPGLEQAEQVYGSLRAMEGLPNHEELAKGHEDELTSYVRAWLAEDRTPAALKDFRALTFRADEIRAQIYAFMQEWPILLLPVASVPAFPPAAAEFRVGCRVLHGLQIESCCRVVTLLRSPVAVVPCGYSQEGLPVGVQVVGRPFHDAEVLAVAAALQRLCAIPPASTATRRQAAP